MNNFEYVTSNKQRLIDWYKSGRCSNICTRYKSGVAGWCASNECDVGMSEWLEQEHKE